MNKGITTLLLIVSIVTALLAVSFWRKSQTLIVENGALRASISDLESSLRQISDDRAQSQTLAAEMQTQKRELMRLRDEVTQLRSAREAATRAEKQVARLQEAQSLTANNSAPPQGGSIPRDEWKFLGYETPQAALISTLFSMKEGEREALLNSFTPEERQRFETQFAEKTDAEVAQRFQKEFGRVTGLQIMAETETAPGELVLDVYLEGLGALKKYRLNQVGNEWKAGAPVNQNPAPVAAQQNPAADPLAFYRKNPELMKRYFPHLFNAQQQQAQPAEQVTEAPPQFDPK